MKKGYNGSNRLKPETLAIRMAVAEAMVHPDFSEKQYTIHDCKIVAERIVYQFSSRKLKVVLEKGK